MRPRVLICDLGNVLVRFDHAPAWNRIDGACATGVGTFERVCTESGFHRGAVNGRGLYDQLVRECGLALSWTAFCSAWCDIFVEDREVVRLAREAKVEYRVLLSNTNQLHWDHIRGTYPHVIAMFDRCVVSHECGLEKPDPAIFRLALIAGIPAEQHLFVDDIASYVEGAREVGIQAFQHRDAAALEHEFRSHQWIAER